MLTIGMLPRSAVQNGRADICSRRLLPRFSAKEALGGRVSFHSGPLDGSRTETDTVFISQHLCFLQ